ncbi:MAG: response regulator [Eubacterium sp.]|nr:response regulator [Eubacterium sp.]
MFAYIIRQTRKNARILADKEAAEAETRVKQEEMEQRLALQDELLAQKQQGERQVLMIKALSSDYRSVYYLELDNDTGICYQARSDFSGFKAGDRFSYLEAVTAYCDQHVLEPYREAFLEFVQPDAIREGLKDNLVISFQYMIQADGRESWEAVKFAGVHHPDEREDHVVHTVGACFVDVDAETRKALEQRQALSDALETAEQANRAKTAFLSNMSHEIRTPMNAIIGLDNIAINDPETPEKTRGYLEKIGASAEHLLNLINDILDMSRIEAGRLIIKNEEFAFPELLDMINTMVSGQCADKGLEYHCYIRGEVDDYYVGDKMKLRQILINILGNAVKFTPVGGKVELTVERTAQYKHQTVLRFTIADTGIGMSKEFLPRLFDTFAQEDSSTTNRYGSSGLGLAITARIVELMSGTISVKSKPGEGSEFTVELDLETCSDPVSEEDASLAGTGGMLSGCRVLLVEDNVINAEIADMILTQYGIKTDLAENGQIGVRKIQAQGPGYYDAVLMDIQMPVMNGYEAARAIRALEGDYYRTIPIIAISANAYDEDVEDCLAAGMNAHLAKPFQPEGLFSVLQKWIYKE